MDTLDIAFKTLKQCGLVWSQYEFSTRWLGRSESYYAYVKSAHALPSTDVLATLIVHLDEFCERDAPYLGARGMAHAEKLANLRNDVWSDVTQRAHANTDPTSTH